MEAISERLEMAKKLAVEAGDLAVAMRQDYSEDFTRNKGTQDFVTLADLAVETLIKDRVAQEFPEDSLQGEEFGMDRQEGQGTWYVDPIDGTTNFMRGLQDWAVSLAYCVGNQVLCAVVFAPDHQELVWASQGNGCYLNGDLVVTSGVADPAQSLVLTGRSNRRPAQEYLDFLDDLISNGLEYRRNGSAAFSLAQVAVGRVDGFFEYHLNSWDAMAGILLVREAGGMVEAEEVDRLFSQGGGAILASNKKLYPVLAEIAH